MIAYIIELINLDNNPDLSFKWEDEDREVRQRLFAS